MERFYLFPFESVQSPKHELHLNTTKLSEASHHAILLFLFSYCGPSRQSFAEIEIFVKLIPFHGSGMIDIWNFPQNKTRNYYY